MCVDGGKPSFVEAIETPQNTAVNSCSDHSLEELCVLFEELQSPEQKYRALYPELGDGAIRALAFEPSLIELEKLCPGFLNQTFCAEQEEEEEETLVWEPAPRKRVSWFPDIPYRQDETGEVVEGPISSQLTYIEDPIEMKAMHGVCCR